MKSEVARLAAAQDPGGEAPETAALRMPAAAEAAVAGDAEVRADRV